MTVPSVPLLLIVLPLAGAALLACASGAGARFSALIALAVALANSALLTWTAGAMFAGAVLRQRIEWLPQAGLDFGLRMDALAWLFALLVSAIGVLVVLYAATYLAQERRARRFFVLLLAFMAAMLGVVLADNLLLLVVFWELTGLSSCLLVGHWHERAAARRGALTALAVTGAGGLALLAGVIIIGHIVGSHDLDTVLASGTQLRAHPLYVPALVLVLLGIYAKSAQFPLHFWLPRAMAAPTPVSAYLHSATMVKAGVFLLARLYPALGGSEAWFWLVAPVGLATLLLGAGSAIVQHDIKALLAYSTVSHLGLITLLFGLGEPLAVVAGLFHLINHATFKASAFMAAGIIEHETGTRDMRALSGLARHMPWTCALATISAAAMAGVPLLNGFLSKEMFFAEAVAGQARGMQYLLPSGALVAGVLSVAYSLRFIHDVFFGGDAPDLPRTPHEPPRLMRIPIELLVLICLAVGILPQVTIAPILAIAAEAALYGGPYGMLPQFQLALWHGFNAPLLMSVLAMIGGAAVYAGLRGRIVLHRLNVSAGVAEVALRALYARAMAGARLLVSQVLSGSLRVSLTALLLAALLAALLPLLLSGGSLFGTRAAAAPVSPAALALWGFGCAAALATVAWYRQRLVAVLLLGAVGLAVALAFVALAAPDLALTQILVEMASLLLLLLALRRLPQESRVDDWAGPSRVAAALMALVAGATMTLLCLIVQSRPVTSIAPFFLDQAKSAGGGSNVVNVIIVDFRGFDTLGEVTVLAVAALVVRALLQPASLRPQAVAAAPVPLLPALLTRWLLPFALVLALHLLLRGHNLPGGGFIAGLVAALAIALLAIGNGRAFLAAALRLDPGWLIGAGLLIALLTGAGALLFDHPFLTSTWAYQTVAGLGTVPLASAMLFDLGVFLVVLGATLTLLIALDPGADVTRREAVS